MRGREARGQSEGRRLVREAAEKKRKERRRKKKKFESRAPLKIYQLLLRLQLSNTQLSCFCYTRPATGEGNSARMASDEIIWDIINQQFCSFKLK